MSRLLPALAALAALAAGPAAAAPCGGAFGAFLGQIGAEAQARGLPPGATQAFLAGAQQDQKVLRADRAQGVFQLTFADFAKRVISQSRMQNGAANARTYDAVFAAIERSYGVPRGVLLAFWGLETDYGAVQGDFNTRNALLTLAHDCRRPDLFQPQVFSAIELTARGDFDPARTSGAWAGEIGMVQMLPDDILRNGVDGDGDGHVSLKTSPPDALMSGARMLRALGWRPGEPWMQEVTVPAGLDWAQSGLNHKLTGGQWAQLGVQPKAGRLADLPASLLLPMGRKGPAFLTYPNYEVLFEWNKSFVYVTTASYFATRLSGAGPFTLGAPEQGLSPSQMKVLQAKLRQRGYDVGTVDGILGEKTREAVQAEQIRQGLPADAWPTHALLGRL